MIPPKIRTLTNLIDADNLVGSIASELSALVNLQYLDVSENSLVGSIPSSLSNLRFLTELVLNSNSLSKSIPTQLSILTRLSTLDVQKNSLTGVLPPSFSSLVAMRYLYVNNNSLTGTLSSSLSTMMTRLTDLSLDFNSLTGSVGNFLCQSSLQSLFLQNNNFTCLASCVVSKAGEGHFDSTSAISSSNCTTGGSSSPSSNKSVLSTGSVTGIIVAALVVFFGLCFYVYSNFFKVTYKSDISRGSIVTLDNENNVRNPINAKWEG